MPIYDYACKECGNFIEDEFGIPGKSIECPICKEQMEPLPPEIQFRIDNAMVTQHKRKYGNNHHAVPKSRDNGVKLYGKPKSKK